MEAKSGYQDDLLMATTFYSFVAATEFVGSVVLLQAELLPKDV